MKGVVFQLLEDVAQREYGHEAWDQLLATAGGAPWSRSHPVLLTGSRWATSSSSWKTAIARFTRTLSTLLSSGVSILEGMEITARTAGNRVIHDAVIASRASIAGGRSISEPLGQSGVFPPMVTQMINVGEETGDLDGMLGKIADFYEDEVDVAVEGLLKALEPTMIAILGTIIGGMIIAMYLPIFGMVSAVQG